MILSLLKLFKGPSIEERDVINSKRFEESLPKRFESYLTEHRGSWRRHSGYDRNQKDFYIMSDDTVPGYKVAVFRKLFGDFDPDYHTRIIFYCISMNMEHVINYHSETLPPFELIKEQVLSGQPMEVIVTRTRCYNFERIVNEGFLTKINMPFEFSMEGIWRFDRSKYSDHKIVDWK